MTKDGRKMRGRVSVLALVLLFAGCSAPSGSHAKIIQGNFLYNDTVAHKSAEETYPWVNRGDSLAIFDRNNMTGGDVTLNVFLANHTLIQSRTYGPHGIIQARNYFSHGTVGTWSIDMKFNDATGFLNFTIQPAFNCIPVDGRCGQQRAQFESAGDY